MFITVLLILFYIIPLIYVILFFDRKDIKYIISFTPILNIIAMLELLKNRDIC